MAKIDMSVLRREVSNTMKGSNSLKRLAQRKAEEAFQEAKTEMLNEFDKHPVTQELKDGPDSENKTGTLGGYGNLHSFIGFEEGHDPTAVVRDYLANQVRLKNNVRYSRAEDTYFFQVEVPSVSEAEQLTPSPWEGRSWTRGIERGISGLGYYIYSKIKEFQNSRSGVAVQAKPKIRDLAYKPVKYLSVIFENFKKKLR